MLALYSSHSSSFISSSLPLSLYLGPSGALTADCTSCDGGVCAGQKLRHRRRDSQEHGQRTFFSPCDAVWMKRLLPGLVCVCLRGNGGETKTSWEIFLYSPDRETKRWRDKIRMTKTKERERRSRAEIVRVRNNLFSLCAWLVGLLYLTPSPNTACLHRRKYRGEKKGSRLCWYPGGRPNWADVFPQLKKKFADVGKSETPASPFTVNRDQSLISYQYYSWAITCLLHWFISRLNHKLFAP